MRLNRRVVVLAKGEYGPFKDAVGTDREGVTYPWVEFADQEQGGVYRATLEQGVDAGTIPDVMQPCELDIELQSDGGKLKLRCHGLAAQRQAVKAA